MAKTLNIGVTAETFSDDFKSKLEGALKQAFGEDVSLKYDDIAAAPAGTPLAKLAQEVAAISTKLGEFATRFENGAGWTGGNGDEAGVKELLQDLIDGVEELKESMGGMTMSSEKEAEITALTEKIKKMQSDADAAKAKADEDEKKRKEEEEAKKKDEVGQYIDSLVSKGQIAPAEKETIRSLMEKADRTKVIKFTDNGKELSATEFDLVKKFIEGRPKVVSFSEVSPQGEFREPSTITVTVRGETYEVKEAELAAEALKFSKDNKVSYEEALIEVSKLKK